MRVAVVAPVLILLLAPQLVAEAPVQATLSLPHDHILPGVPFEIVVTFKNVSEQPLTIGGAGATLVVTFETGETRVMHKPEGADQWGLGSPHAPKTVAPGQSVQLAAGWESGIPNWFVYESFSRPGACGIALDLEIVDGYTEPLGAVRTNAATLTRIEPVGIDAELWKRVQDVSKGRWAAMWFQSSREGEALAEEIRQLHPASGYYPYALAVPALLQPKRSSIPALLEAAGRFQDSPAYPYLLTAAANCARYAGLVAEREGGGPDARKYLELAGAQYRAALTTGNVGIRERAERELRTVTRHLDIVMQKTR